MSTDTAIHGPHQRIAGDAPRERFLARLFDTLWERYRGRVAYVQTYERLVQAAGATFVNDHIAFRTFACQQPLTGIASVSRVFEALGYQAANLYRFDDKHLSAMHFQHPNPNFPKLFISELRVWELSLSAGGRIEQTVAGHRPPLSGETLAELAALSDHAAERANLLAEVAGWIHHLPWPAPERADVAAVNRESQYGAWVLVHGYNVNHFTSFINSHGVEALGDIEKTIAALRAAGVPMKAEIEGERGSKLRQSSTEAVVIDVDVRDDGQPIRMPWTYAYFELAERGEVTDPSTGRRIRFDGFLGAQATNLFEMTRKA